MHCYSSTIPIAHDLSSSLPSMENFENGHIYMYVEFRSQKSVYFAPPDQKICHMGKYGDIWYYFTLYVSASCDFIVKSYAFWHFLLHNFFNI